MAPTHEPPQPFTDQLRAASRRQHANNTAVVASKLLVVLTHRQQYGRALCCFWHVHRALEAHIAACASLPELELLAPVVSTLHRAAAFEQDVRWYLGKDWQEAPSPEVSIYLTRLEELSRHDPVRLLAHAWGQDAALLAGGQIIQRMVRRALRLGRGPGTAAFTFEERPEILRQKLKHAVNSVPLTEHQRQCIVAEHCLVFKLNSDIVKGFRIQWRSVLAMHRRATLITVLLIVVFAYAIVAHIRT